MASFQILSQNLASAFGSGSSSGTNSGPSSVRNMRSSKITFPVNLQSSNDYQVIEGSVGRKSTNNNNMILSQNGPASILTSQQSSQKSVVNSKNSGGMKPHITNVPLELEGSNIAIGISNAEKAKAMFNNGQRKKSGISGLSISAKSVQIQSPNFSLSGMAPQLGASATPYLQHITGGGSSATSPQGNHSLLAQMMSFPQSTKHFNETNISGKVNTFYFPNTKKNSTTIGANKISKRASYTNLQTTSEVSSKKSATPTAANQGTTHQSTDIIRREPTPKQGVMSSRNQSSNEPAFLVDKRKTSSLINQTNFLPQQSQLLMHSALFPNTILEPKQECASPSRQQEINTVDQQKLLQELSRLQKLNSDYQVKIDNLEKTSEHQLEMIKSKEDMILAIRHRSLDKSHQSMRNNPQQVINQPQLKQGNMSKSTLVSRPLSQNTSFNQNDRLSPPPHLIPSTIRDKQLLAQSTSANHFKLTSKNSQHSHQSPEPTMIQTSKRTAALTRSLLNSTADFAFTHHPQQSPKLKNPKSFISTSHLEPNAEPMLRSHRQHPSQFSSENSYPCDLESTSPQSLQMAASQESIEQALKSILIRMKRLLAQKIHP